MGGRTIQGDPKRDGELARIPPSGEPWPCSDEADYRAASREELRRLKREHNAVACNGSVSGFVDTEQLAVLNERIRLIRKELRLERRIAGLPTLDWIFLAVAVAGTAFWVLVALAIWRVL
jgi:hypothetical protein